MSKLANIITMAELLSSNRKYSIDELSKKLEVTPRMIRFYKEELEIAGIYIDSIRGPYGGYVLNQTIRIPNRKFNRKDVLLLESLNKANNQDLSILIDKVRGIYQVSKEETRELELSGATLSKYNALTKAIKEKRKIKIKYFSYEKGENERIIHPYDMYLYENGWGIAAFCELEKDLRTFEFKRIINYELLDKYFK